MTEKDKKVNTKENKKIRNYKVSILVPIYNVEPYICQCLDSIVNQTLKDIEIILLDDGSKDNCSKICDEYAKKDDRIKVIHKDNSGYGNSMNIGIDNATGEYIGIVEPDDYVELDMFETLYNAAKEKDVDIVESQYRKFTKENNKDICYKKNGSDVVYNKILTPSLTPKLMVSLNSQIWTAIYRTSFIKKNNIRFNETPGASYQDTGFLIQTRLLAKSLYIIDNIFYNYRCDNPNQSVKNKSKVYVLCNEYQFIYDILSKHNFDQHVYNAVLYRKFDGYLWNLDRIAFDYKKDFLRKMVEEFKDVKDEELEYFGKAKKKKFKLIVNNPEKYFEEYINYVWYLKVKLWIIQLFEIVKRISGEIRLKLFGITVLKTKKIGDKRTKIYLFGFVPLLTIKALFRKDDE